MRKAVVFIEAAVACFLILSAAAVAAEDKQPAGDRWAVVIGIDDYQDLGKLTTAVSDAKAVAKVLVDSGGFDANRVILLTDDAADPQNRPTTGTIKKRIEKTAQFTEAGDTLLVFFSGHGVVNDGKGYLVPSDGDQKNGIALDWVKETLAGAKASSKILILDACHAGAGAKGVSGIAPSLLAGETGTAMLLSCSSDQVSYSDPDGANSIFTRYLVEALSGAADANSDGVVSCGEAYAYIKARMKDWYVKTGKAQSPALFPQDAVALALTRAIKRPAAVMRIEPTAAAPRVPEGFHAKDGTTAEPYTNTGWAKEVVHDKTGMEMVFIPAGEFQMGSPDSEAGRDKDEGPIHKGRINKPFYLGKYQVTVGQFRKFAESESYRTEAETGGGAYAWSGSAWEKKADASWRNPYFTQTDQHPVVCVTWNDAIKFCGWAGLQLPTEAEREYACRAGSTTRFSFGDSDGQLGDYAWYYGNSGNMTHPVGEKRPNAWGLYDMHGNVWQWCADWYGETYYQSSPADDPQGPSSGTSRVLRGGSWNFNAQACRSAFRYGFDPSVTSGNFGLRVRRGL